MTTKSWVKNLLGPPFIKISGSDMPYQQYNAEHNDCKVYYRRDKYVQTVGSIKVFNALHAFTNT